MDREIELAGKAAELSETLQSWAQPLLVPGEQLLVSLRIQKVPMVIRDPDDEGPVNPQILGMLLLDFFTQERLEEAAKSLRRNRLGHARSAATRVRASFKRWMTGAANLTLRQFLDEYRERDLLRLPNLAG